MNDLHIHLFILLFTATLISVYACRPVYGPTNPTPATKPVDGPKRYGSVIELREGMEQTYRELHADVWAEVIAAIKRANIRNYTIFVGRIDGKTYLFSYFEYVGIDAERDFASINTDDITKHKWWPLTSACQTRLPTTPEGDQWLPMEQVMHID